MININKLFPRLSIRHKLSIAFAAVALVPLTVVAFFGARSSARQIEAAARNTVEHDLRLAERLTVRELEASGRHVAFMAQAELAPMLLQERGADRRAGADLAMTQLIVTEPTLFRVKLIDADGREIMAITRDGVQRTVDHAGRGTFYAWRAEQMKAGERALLPVELDVRGADGNPATLAAIAILVPIADGEGEFAGVAVGEAYASSLMAGLDAATPGYDGVTALVDVDGLFLYHSVRKRDWARLLVDRERVGMTADLAPSVADLVLHDTVGAVRTPDENLVSFRRLQLGSAGEGPPLTLYRVVDGTQLTAPVRRFLRWALLGGALVAAFVLGVAVVAGEQLTRPIRRIQDSMWRLAKGEPGPLPEVASNDEIEDLASDFRVVAAAIEEHRANREALLSDRTRALEVTHAELVGIVANSADAIIGTDESGNVRLWNQAAVRLFGYSEDEIQGRNLATLLSGSACRAPDDQRFIDAELLRSGEVTDFRTTRHARDGTPIPVSLSQSSVRDRTGALVGYSVIVRDRRAQEMLETQMRRSERLAAMSVVAASVAHEINNPLGIVANRIELMQRDARRGMAHERTSADLAVLMEHVQRAAAVTSDLLRFARDDSGHVEPVRLGEVVSRHCALLRRTLATRGIRVEVDVAPSLPTVMASAKAVESVLLNLLLNASDATPAGGLVRVTVRRQPASECLEIAVDDSGTGVPSNLQERIFEPFFTTKADGRGTGLGLTVCRSMVERMGGKIRVQDSDLGGAAFVIQLPLRAAEGVA